jgi:MerR family transcriptional regulator, repressor of the yfmOP operon
MIETQEQLLRIHEVGRRLGLTSRAIRYYEELGLLTPSGRTEGDHRLFDQADIERLQTIKSLRDDAGFSLADIGALLSDEDERAASRAAYHGTTDVQERRGLLVEELDRVDRHVTLLRGKIDRLAGMIGEAEARRARCLERIAAIDASGKDDGA